jgi:hypothetical protein
MSAPLIGPFSAHVYNDMEPPPRSLADVPGTWWLRVDMRSPTGGHCVFIYDREPDDPAELPSVMWQLQREAGLGTFEITVTREDGISSKAPGINPGPPLQTPN